MFVQEVKKRRLAEVDGDDAGWGVKTLSLTKKKKKGEKSAWARFLELNVQLLDLKKFELANAEAARKILKKHEKRTALLIPTSQRERIFPLLVSLNPNQFSGNSGTGGALVRRSISRTSLPHMLVVLMTDTLLPVIPSIDDYLCLICTSLAFKPIRLNCHHLFCVRCLVKMQKRGSAECPLCRAQTVLIADRRNVDWSLLRFMEEYFPEEARLKAKSNEKEAAEEELREMGLSPDACVIA
jgi:hypothetical protein